MNTHNLGCPSADNQTQKWYFEQWHQYQNKKKAIQWLYLDVLKWAAQKSGLNFLNGRNIAVDVGSAHGYVGLLLNKLGYEVYGCELSRFYSHNYARKNTPNMIVCDAQRLPFLANKISLITAFEIVEHLPQNRKFLNNCYDVLKIDGALVLTTPNAGLKKADLKYWRDYAEGSLIFNSHNLEGHCHEFVSSKELMLVLKQAGFGKVFIETWWFAPVPPSILGRYFVGSLPLFMIPHFRCVALKA